MLTTSCLLYVFYRAEMNAATGKDAAGCKDDVYVSSWLSVGLLLAEDLPHVFFATVLNLLAKDIEPDGTGEVLGSGQSSWNRYAE